MRLFAMPGTCALAPNIAAVWASTDVEVVNLERGDHRKRPYLAINPKGQVPALELQPDVILTEAAAILIYLADLSSDSGLAPSDPFARARMIEALSYMTSEVHADYSGHFAPERSATSQAAIEEVRSVTYDKLRRHYKRLDRTLSEAGDWYLGDRSVADAYLYVLARWVDGTPLSIGDYPALEAFRGRMDVDADVKVALQRQNMD